MPVYGHLADLDDLDVGTAIAKARFVPGNSGVYGPHANKTLMISGCCGVIADHDTAVRVIGLLFACGRFGRIDAVGEGREYLQISYPSFTA